LLPWHTISEKSRDLQDLMYLRIHHGPANPDFFHCWRTLTTFASTGFCNDGVYKAVAALARELSGFVWAAMMAVAEEE
jgi:hypothetical protein